MMRRSLLILGQRSRSTLALCILARYKLQFLSNHFQTSHGSCWWWEEEPYWFRVVGSKVKVNFGTLCIKPCGHDTDYRFCPITFKLRMQVVDGASRNPIGFGSRGQRSTLGLCSWNLVDTMQATVFARSFSNFVSCWWWEERPYSFWVIGPIVVVNFAPARGCHALCCLVQHVSF